jgi:hypothetical protein
MEWVFSCPRCDAVINPGGIVMLVAAQDGARMLIGLHPEPGNYELFLPPGFVPIAGSEWDFYCPVCQASLTCQDHRKLCELVQIVGNERRRLLFSRIAGERATYVLCDDDGIVERHGDHADRYDDTVRLTPQRKARGQ